MGYQQGLAGGLIGLIAGAVGAGGIATKYYSDHVAQSQVRQQRLLMLSDRLSQLRQTEIDEISANNRAYNAAGGGPGAGDTVPFRNGVDPATVSARERAQQAAMKALASAPSDEQLIDCVHKFQNGVSAAVFATKVHQAVLGNRAASTYLAASDARINTLVNQSSTDLLLGKFHQPGSTKCAVP